MKKSIIVPVGYSTESLCTPEFIKLTFTPEAVAKCKRMMKLVKDEDLHGVKINFYADYFEDEECTEVAPFRSDVNYLSVSEDRIVFYAQSKHDSSIQIESPEISIEIEETNLGRYVEPTNPETALQLWLDAEEELRNGNDELCNELKDLFQVGVAKFSPEDKKETEEQIESIGG